MGRRVRPFGSDTTSERVPVRDSRAGNVAAVITWLLRLWRPSTSKERPSGLYSGRASPLAPRSSEAPVSFTGAFPLGLLFRLTDTALNSERTANMNLDATDIDDLRAFHDRLRKHLVAEARTLFPDRPQGYLRAARTLKNYAANKATAMGLRLAGKIADALRYEAICERLYGQLPDFARW